MRVRAPLRGRGEGILASSVLVGGQIAITAGAALLAVVIAVPLLYFMGQHPLAIPALAIAAPIALVIAAQPRWIVPVFIGFLWSLIPPDVLGGIPSPADLGTIALTAVTAWLVVRERELARQVGTVILLIGASFAATGLVASGGPVFYSDGFKAILFVAITAFCVRRVSDVDRVTIALCAVGMLLGLGSAIALIHGPFGPFVISEPVGPLDPNPPRAAGILYGDPNFFALSEAALIPLALRFVGMGAGRRWFGLATMVGIFAGVLATGSRGGLVAAAAATALWAFFAGTARMRKTAIVTVLCVIGLAPLFSTQLAASSSRDVSLRLNENRIAGAMFVEHPVTGIGPGRYPDLFRDYSLRFGNDPRVDRYPHSLPLQIAAEQGIVGTVAWLAAGMLIVRYARRRRVWETLLGRSVILSLVTYLIGSFFLHGSELRLPFILAGLIFAMGAHRGEGKAAAVT